MHDKIKQLEEIDAIVSEEKKRGAKVVHCHGVFDLLHPGHIKHLISAKKKGDKLIVTITPDRFVNKGPGRPVFNEVLRLEQIASLSCVDYAVLNDSPDAVDIIGKIKPDIYVKGGEYRNHVEDITGKMSQEALAAEDVGAIVHYTDDEVFSSSTLLNRYFDADAQRVEPFLSEFRKHFSRDFILSKIEEFSKLRVLIIGDAIIDEYQYVEPLGQSGKGVHMTARCLEKETFIGGSLILANHVKEFVKEVTLLTGVGLHCPHHALIDQKLSPKVRRHFYRFESYPTLLKRRYVLKDGELITKLFETYSSNDLLLDEMQTDAIVSFLQTASSAFDLVLVSDFGNGFTNPRIIEAISHLNTFVAVNTQTNSGNRGYNAVTHYSRADFISVNEPELRLAAHDRSSPLEKIIHDISVRLSCPEISVTRGVAGASFFTKDAIISVPALTTRAIDRVGAGDCYFALSAMGSKSSFSPELSAFLGSVAAAMSVQIIGNKESIDKIAYCKYIARLLK